MSDKWSPEEDADAYLHGDDIQWKDGVPYKDPTPWVEVERRPLGKKKTTSPPLQPAREIIEEPRNVIRQQQLEQPIEYGSGNDEDISGKFISSDDEDDDDDHKPDCHCAKHKPTEKTRSNSNDEAERPVLKPPEAQRFQRHRDSGSGDDAGFFPSSESFPSFPGFTSPRSFPDGGGAGFRRRNFVKRWASSCAYLKYDSTLNMFNRRKRRRERPRTLGGRPALEFRDTVDYDYAEFPATAVGNPAASPQRAGLESLGGYLPPGFRAQKQVRLRRLRNRAMVTKIA